MLSSSNTYSFGTDTQIDDLIKESFERIGIIGNEFTGLQIQSAIMSSNLELTSWMGKTPLSWTIKRFMTSLVPGQQTYSIPKSVSKIIDMYICAPYRLYQGGVAFSSSGSADNCFNPLSTSGCVQTSPNGNIGYNFSSVGSQCITYVGIQSLTTKTYTLVVENSVNNVDWNIVCSIPTQVYQEGILNWFVVINAISAQSWRIRETSGQTLEIEQIYFSQPSPSASPDRFLREMSYSEWMQVSNKLVQSSPNQYLFDNQISPVINLYPVLGVSASTNQYTAIVYSAYQYMDDVTLLFNTFNVPQRFYEALVAGISARLAQKFALERYQILKGLANEAFDLATRTDATNVYLRFQPDFSSYSRIR